MTLKERTVVLTGVDSDGNTTIDMPVTAVENVEGAIKTVDGYSPDINGDIKIDCATKANILEAADKALTTVTNVGNTDIAGVLSAAAGVEAAIAGVASQLDLLKNAERVNSSGDRWIRYESGLQICFGSTTTTTSSTTGSFYYGISSTMTFPVAFINTPTVVCSALDNFTGVAFAMTNNTTPTTLSLEAIATSKNVIVSLYFIAIGYWK